jgi:HlyD family secretion protein
MRKRTVIIALVIVILAGGGYFLLHDSAGAKVTSYQFATVSRGNIETTVSATGTLSPVTTVEVGTQVSGTIDSVFVDYNDHVKAGQILAVLDTTLLWTSVIDAEASESRAEAQLQQAQTDFNRAKDLYERKLISDSDYVTAQVTLKSQQATLKSAQAALERARRNLTYAVIRSPINGIVIGKDIEEGQTVAASLSTPTLFVIAQDLSHMEILTDVDETDIGLIKTGQPVRFEVAAYVDKEFSGVVEQVRLQPQTVSNVVTYTAVVEAPNPEGLLLPGMTATVDFITEERDSVLMVPNKALRFEPSEDQLKKYEEQHPAPAAPHHSGANAQTHPDTTAMQHNLSAQMGGLTPTGGESGSFGTVWYLDSLGHLEAAHLVTGLSDAKNTEVVRSRTLTDGTRIIVGTGSNTPSALSTMGEEGRPRGFHFRGF